ncbi:hypothetical protein AEYBE204_09380 [Asticcacaulis sp. YBE204]|nr:hypothetical protein AEYBE204_09380 [Asticcacaulis sp. YBE204]
MQYPAISTRLMPQSVTDFKGNLMIKPMIEDPFEFQTIVRMDTVYRVAFTNLCQRQTFETCPGCVGPYHPPITICNPDKCRQGIGDLFERADGT